MSTTKEPMTKVINGHMYEIREDKTQAKPIALSIDAAIAAKSDPEHYLNKTLELDPKTLEPIIKNEEKKATNKLQEMLAKSEESEEAEVKNEGPDFV